MKLNIDLGKSSGFPLTESSESYKYYPSFNYDGDKKMDLPEEGEMTIYYKKTGSSENTHDGKTRYSCTIEVRKIESVESDDEDVEAPARNRGKATEDALDALVAAHAKSKY